MQHTRDMHIALNHAHINVIRRSIQDQLTCIGTPPTPVQLTCSGFHMGKMSRQPHRRKQHNYDVGEVIFTDVCGPMRTKGNLGKLYLLTFTDIASRYSFLFPITGRSQVVEWISRAVLYAHSQTGRWPRFIHAEYVSKVVEYTMDKIVSELKTTVKHIPE